MNQCLLYKSSRYLEQCMHMTKGLYEKRPVVRQGWQKIECRKVNPLSWASQDIQGADLEQGVYEVGRTWRGWPHAKARHPLAGLPELSTQQSNMSNFWSSWPCSEWPKEFDIFMSIRRRRRKFCQFMLSLQKELRRWRWFKTPCASFPSFNYCQLLGSLTSFFDALSSTQIVIHGPEMGLL